MDAKIQQPGVREGVNTTFQLAVLILTKDRTGLTTRVCQLWGAHLISQAEWTIVITRQEFGLVLHGGLQPDHGGNPYQGIGKRRAQKGANRRVPRESMLIWTT
jgi:hypothetical protein